MDLVLESRPVVGSELEDRECARDSGTDSWHVTISIKNPDTYNWTAHWTYHCNINVSVYFQNFDMRYCQPKSSPTAAETDEISSEVNKNEEPCQTRPTSLKKTPQPYTRSVVFFRYVIDHPSQRSAARAATKIPMRKV